MNNKLKNEYVQVSSNKQRMWNYNEEVTSLKHERKEWKGKNIQEKCKQGVIGLGKNEHSIDQKKRKLNEMSRNEKDSWLEKELKQRPPKYQKLSDEYYESTLLTIFDTLHNITNIIGLSTHPKRFDLMNNKKFKSLYRLIPSLIKLNNIIGMESVKLQVFRMICYFVHSLNTDQEINHIVITGQSGIGKTTLAKVLGSIYLELGFLTSKTFKTVKRSDLIGKYCGHTAKKTQDVFNKAEGGVLFIDEVYSLGNPDKKDVFTKECIDTINQNLSEKANNLLVIVAGYEKDVENCFFAYNEGLRRRFSLWYKIEPYNADELYRILILKIKECNWHVDTTKLNKSFIDKYYKKFKYMGADMVKLLKYAKENYSIRLMRTSIYIDMNQTKFLKICDFKYAVGKFPEIKQEDLSVMYSMYT